MGFFEQGDRTKVVLTQRFPVENLRKIVLHGITDKLECMLVAPAV
jgi:hypothetical protein